MAGGEEVAVLDVYTLRRGRVYRVLRDFSDFYGYRFSSGERLTFSNRQFLPHDGGHTVVFLERRLYLQEQENAGILEHLDQYLQECGRLGNHEPPVDDRPAAH